MRHPNVGTVYNTSSPFLYSLINNITYLTVLFMGIVMDGSLCLVTELLARGSLDDVIMACTKDENYTLDWTKRIEFAVDACHGFSFLSPS